MSDQSPPPVDPLEEAIRQALANESALRHPNADAHVIRMNQVSNLVAAVRPLLDAITAERDALATGLRNISATHEAVTVMARGLRTERDQARAALRELVEAVVRNEALGDSLAEDGSLWAEQNPALHEALKAATAALAGAPSGDTPQPAPSRDLSTNGAVRDSGGNALASIAALADAWEAWARSLAPGEHTERATLSTCARELRAALGDMPYPPGLPANMDDLLTPDQHAGLRADLGDMARKRRAAEAASASLPVGGSADEWAIADAAISIPRDPAQRAALYAQVGLTEDEKAAVERWIATQAGDTPDPEPAETLAQAWDRARAEGRLDLSPLAVQPTEELAADIERAQSDPEFAARLAGSMERNARVLERLAEVEAAEQPTEELAADIERARKNPPVRTDSAPNARPSSNASARPLPLPPRRPPMAADNEAITLRLPADLHRATRKRAEQEDRSMSSLIRVALREYLRRHEEDPRG